MAGFYPDAPGKKIQWIEDGTVTLRTSKGGGSGNLGSATEPSGAELTKLQSKSSGDSWTEITPYIGVGPIWIFPELRDIDGTFLVGTTDTTTAAMIYSKDTTNGQDGSWTVVSTTQLEVCAEDSIIIPAYREDIFGWTATGVRCVTGYIASSSLAATTELMHADIYGEITAGQSPDRLLFINDASGVEYAAPQDYGDRPRGSAVDVDIRIKNNSGTLQANTIDVTKGRTESDPDDASTWYTLDNGAGFGASFQVASLGSGTEDTFTLRQNIPDTAVPGLYETWLKYAVTSWS